MEARPASGLVVSALIRRIEGEGGSGVVIAKGDSTAGAILLMLSDRGKVTTILERTLGVDGYRWQETGPPDATARDAYLVGRRRFDPDLWILELDHSDARTLALDLLQG